MTNFTEFELNTIDKGWKYYHKNIKYDKTSIREIRVCIYLRKSTEDIKDNSLKLQKDEIKKFINSINETYKSIYRFYYTNNDVYAEDNVSGMQGRARPEFNRMLSMIESNPGYYGLCVVYKLDRFSRKLEDTLSYISLLKSFKCVLKALDFEDNGDPTSDLLRNMLGIVAQYHAQNSALTSIKGTYKKVEENKAVGLLPMGLIQEKIINNDVNNKGASKIIIDESKAPIIREIFTLFSRGLSIGDIELQLIENDYKNKRGNFISRQQIKYILTNKRYNGTYIYADPSKSRKRKFDNGVRKPDYYEKKNAFPKIIDDDLFERVQKIIMSNNSSHHLSSASTIYLLSDLCVCGCCHNKLTGWSRPKYKGKIYYDYVCKTHKNNSTKCPTKRINKMYVENIILDIVIIIINKIMPKLKNEFNDYLKIKLEKYLNKRNIKEDELIEKNKKLDKLIERSIKDNTKSVIYEKRINELEEEIVKLTNSLNELNNIIDNKKIYYHNLTDNFILTKELLETDKLNSKLLIKLLIKKIVITNQEIIIKLNVKNGK